MRRFLIALLLAVVPGPLPCLAQRRMPSGDPNLNAHWDWTTKEAQALYYHRPGQAPGRVDGPLPFSCPGNRLCEAPGNLYPEDGWRLVHRDFGTEQAAPPIPYFTLYNQIRGIFRIMLCQAAQPGEARFAGMLQLHPESVAAGHGAPLFTFSNSGGRCFRSDYEPGQVEVAFSPMDKGNGWMVFDFQMIGYDPDLDRKDPRLLFTLHRLSSSGGDCMNLGLGAAQADLEAALKAGGPGYRHYPNARSWFEAERARADLGCTPAGNHFQVIASTQPASCGPLVAALGGHVNGWLGGTHAACSWEPISHQGQVSTPVRPCLGEGDQLSLVLCLQAGGGQEAPGHRPVQALAWGLFNFEAGPVLAEQPILGEEAEGSRRVVLAATPRLHLNPEGGLELLAMSFEANLRSRQADEAGPGVYEGLLPIATDKGPALPRQDSVTDLIVTMQFKTRQPTREADDHYTVVRRLPCKFLSLDVADPGPSPAATPRSSGPGTASSSGASTPSGCASSTPSSSASSSSSSPASTPRGAAPG